MSLVVHLTWYLSAGTSPKRKVWQAVNRVERGLTHILNGVKTKEVWKEAQHTGMSGHIKVNMVDDTFHCTYQCMPPVKCE